MMNNFCWIKSVLVLTLAVVVGCNDSDNSSSTEPRMVVTGNGVILEETRQVSGFTAVAHASEGDLHIEQVQGGQEGFRVQADENLLLHIITEVQDGTLEIRTESDIELMPTQTIEFHLTVVDLNSVVLSGVGEVEAPSLSADELSLTLSGVGNMECTDLDATTLTVVNSGVGNVSCSGQVDEQTVTLTGVGNYAAPNLLSREATVSVSGVSSATVNVSERLTATVSGAGSVTYIDSSGGGLIVDCTPISGCLAQ